jgi:hypothetical protein
VEGDEVDVEAGSEVVAPPDDADDWTNEQWIEWLKATDEPSSEAPERAPATVAGRVVHSTGGQLLGQGMLGLARAIYGRQSEKPAIVVDAGSEPEDEELTVHLDPDHPENSYAVLRRERDTEH